MRNGRKHQKEIDHFLYATRCDAKKHQSSLLLYLKYIADANMTALTLDLKCLVLY